jgi:glycosyltransferase involved in cell wall biosynthesis
MSRSILPAKIYVNGRFLTQATTGVQRYALESLNAIDALLRSGCNGQWIVLVPKGTDSQAKWNNIELRTVGILSGHAWEQLELPRYASDGWLLTLCGAPSLLHSAHLFAIHDAAIYDMPSGYSLLYRTYYRILYRLCVNRAKAVFTVSEFSRNRLASLFPNISSRIVITYNGADHSGSPSAMHCKQPVEKSVLQHPYILAVNSLAPNKNFGTILKLSEMLADTDLRVVVVGGSNSRVFAKAEYSPLKVSWLGYVSDEELDQLYRHASCFVFPSLYEGFGLPPIEAMTRGCPVIASNAASIPEICGDAALYFDPRSVEALKAQILRVMQMPSIREDLRRKGYEKVKRYSWNKVALAIVNTIGSLI